MKILVPLILAVCGIGTAAVVQAMPTASDLVRVGVICGGVVVTLYALAGLSTLSKRLSR